MNGLRGSNALCVFLVLISWISSPISNGILWNPKFTTVTKRPTFMHHCEKSYIIKAVCVRTYTFYFFTLGPRTFLQALLLSSNKSNCHKNKSKQCHHGSATNPIVTKTKPSIATNLVYTPLGRICEYCLVHYTPSGGYRFYVLQSYSVTGQYRLDWAL